MECVGRMMTRGNGTKAKRNCNIPLLKNDGFFHITNNHHARQQMVIQNDHMLLSIHPPLNHCKLSNSIPFHTVPNHIVRDPPPNLTVSPICLSPSGSTAFSQTYCTPDHLTK